MSFTVALEPVYYKVVGPPRDYAELFTQYNTFIDNLLRRINKIPSDTEDLKQEIKCKLVNAKLLEKFRSFAAQTLPPVLTAQEAIDYLGVSWCKFHSALKKAAKADLGIEPVEGTLLSKDAAFSSKDIKILDDLGLLPEKRGIRRRPPVLALGFTNYLGVAIRRHFANWVRTKKRRVIREITLDPSSVVSHTVGNSYKLSCSGIEQASWEQTLTDDIDSDTDWAIKCSIFFRAAQPLALQHGIDLSRAREIESFVREDGTIRVRPTETAQKALKLLDRISRGATTVDWGGNPVMSIKAMVLQAL